ncbi:hypothetical protein V5799_020087 [Amblyomma americanum]|uniref:Uncharacterized protein n=1 Tax=Amblyomma americanum TaxID=6943 RepID=A0AAQ4EUV7_AMBAM
MLATVVDKILRFLEQVQCMPGAPVHAGHYSGQKRYVFDALDGATILRLPRNFATKMAAPCSSGMLSRSETKAACESKLGVHRRAVRQRKPLPPPANVCSTKVQNEWLQAEDNIPLREVQSVLVH